jgi:hypothetical protein
MPGSFDTKHLRNMNRNPPVEAESRSGTSPGRPYARALLIGFTLLITSALVVVIQSGNALRFDDELRYHDLANSILHDHGYAWPDGTLTAWWPPGYTFAVTAAYAVYDRPIAAKALNVGFLALATYFAMLTAQRLRQNSGLLVPYLVLCYPVLLYTASALYPQTLGSFLLILIVWLVSVEGLSIPRAAVAGVLCGVLCLAIPAFILTIPVLLVALLISGRTSFNSSLAKVVVIAIVAMITISPWTMRNYRVFHAFVPVSTNGGTNLLQGNSSLTRPNGPANISLLCPEAPDAGHEVQHDRSLSRCAREWVAGNPKAAMRLYLGKLLNYFNYTNPMRTRSETTFWRDAIMFITYYPLLLLAVVRLMFARHMRISRTEALLYLLYFLNAGTSALFYTRVRFRLPYDLLLIVIDAAFIARLIPSLQRLREIRARLWA